MPQLFYGNFDFEETLAAPHRQTTAVVQRILAELAPTWMAIAREGDLIWCPQAIDPQFFERLASLGFGRVTGICEFDGIPPGCDFVPWGWTQEAIDWAARVGASVESPPLEAVCTVNSRRFASEQESLRGLRLPGSRVVTTWDDLADAVDALRSQSIRSIIKCEFSQSGRDRLIIDSLDSGRREKLATWAMTRLEAGRPLFVEPWLDGRAEASIQLSIERDGHVSLEGIAGTRYHRGAFAAGDFSLSPDKQSLWRDAVSIALEVSGEAARLGYFGPLGIDAMRYRDVDGRMRLRAIQDINARWTMGRLGLGHRWLLQPGQRGQWLMGQSATEPMAKGVPRTRGRIIETSPRQIAGRPVRLRSCVVIDRSS